MRTVAPSPKILTREDIYFDEKHFVKNMKNFQFCAKNESYDEIIKIKQKINEEFLQQQELDKGYDILQKSLKHN